METTMAQSKEKPCWTPAKTHKVIVPGPIKAAVTMNAGPPLNIENIDFYVQDNVFSLFNFCRPQHYNAFQLLQKQIHRSAPLLRQNPPFVVYSLDRKV